MKNALVAGIVGLLFMAGGFAIGFKMMPKPKAVAAAAAPVATTEMPPGAAVPVPTADAISMDTLKKTSESMLSLNVALAEREKHVAEREAKVKQREDELDAERAALDSSHEKFKALFNDFQSRLQLVEANQMQQMQKQAEFYDAMGPDQSIDLIRTMDDNAVTRLFSVMETKSLAKLVGAWRKKYPDDSTRLLRALTNTAQVIDKSKMALNDPLETAPPSPASTPVPAVQPDAAAPTPDSAAPAPEAAPDTNPSDTSTPAIPPLAPPREPETPTNPRPATTSIESSTPASDVAADTATPASATPPDPTIPGAIGAAASAEAAAIPVAHPASPSDLMSDDPLPQAPRAQPATVSTAATN